MPIPQWVRPQDSVTVPDTVAPVSTLSDIELRMGIPSLESLLAERDTLVKELAPLRAKHGPGGIFGDLRKAELAKVAAMIRAMAVGSQQKVTEAFIEESAHQHPTYTDFLTQATVEKARYFELENRAMGIADLIQRGNAVARYLAAEAHLS